MEKQKHKLSRVFIGLGSNMGDKSANLQKAQQLIGLRVGKIIRRSAVYQTEPWGYRDQPEFFNQVLEIETTCDPENLLKELLLIEEVMGRKRTFKNASRTIDLDILFYADQIINHSDVTIPHPRISERRFVLEPLNEIVPDFIHPIMKKSMRQLLSECHDQLYVRRRLEDTTPGQTAKPKNNQEAGA